MSYAGNPNGQNQLWSKWTFTVWEAGKRPARADVELNVARWLRKGFGSVSAARVSKTVLGWRFECLTEGRPAHDPEYVAAVRSGFKDFVEKGWGVLASCKVNVKIMAGSKQDGKPAEQMVVMPHIDLRN